MTQVTLYGRATSSNVQVVRWALLEFGVPFERIDVGGAYGGLDTPDFLAMNPNGKIPVLQDGDLILFESSAILRYLADTYGPAAAWPKDTRTRAPLDVWAEWAKQGPANHFTTPIFWRVVRTPEDRHDTQAIRTAVDAFEAEVQIAETRLATRAWLCGDSMTLADLIFGHILYRYFDIDIERRSFPNVQRYYRQLTSRDAYRTAVMVSYESLRNTF